MDIKSIVELIILGVVMLSGVFAIFNFSEKIKETRNSTVNREVFELNVLHTANNMEKIYKHLEKIDAKIDTNQKTTDDNFKAIQKTVDDNFKHIISELIKK